MVKRNKRPATRGSVNNIILEILSNGDKYGYEIIKEVEEATNGAVILKQPSLYSSLSRFETKGFVSSYWEDSAIGGRRHYYSLTPTGKNYYEKVVKKYEDDEEENQEDVNNDFDDTYTVDDIDDEQPLNKYKFDLKSKVDELLNSTNKEDVTYEDSSNEYSEIEENKDLSVYESDNDDNNAEEKENDEEDIFETNDFEQCEEEHYKEYDYNDNSNKTTTTNESSYNEEADFVNESDNINDSEQSVFVDTNTPSEEMFDESFEDDALPSETSNNTVSNEIEASTPTKSHISEANINAKTIESNNENDDGYRKEKNNDIHENLNEIYKSLIVSKNNKQIQDNANPYIRTKEEERKHNESMKRLYGNQNDIIDNQKESVKPKLFIDEISEETTKPVNEYKKLLDIVDNNYQNQNENLEQKRNEEQIKPKKHFVVDEYGIMKIAEDIPKKEDKIYDNVGFRTNDNGNNVVEYKEPQIKTINKLDTFKMLEINDNEPTIKYNDIELSEEEREEKQRMFNEKFENLQKERQLQKENGKEANYQNLLNDTLFIEDDEDADNDKPHSTFHNKNVRLFRKSNGMPDDEEQDIEQNDENNKINEIKSNSAKAVKMEDNSILNIQKELINQGVDFNTYASNTVKAKDSDFFLANKLKLFSGLILTLLIAIETIIALIVSKRMELLNDNNKYLLLSGFGLAFIIGFTSFIPLLTCPNKRKLNNSKLIYNFLFGLFAFILICIGSYAVNTLIGMTLDNIRDFYVTLLYPPLIALNFVIMPFINKLLLQSKAFY